MSAPHMLTTLHDAVAWLREHVTGTLQTDSRLIQPGDGFIAWPGAATDGRAHVGDAMARGDRVELRGFGAFSVKNRPARVGRNPRTGEQVDVGEKYVPQFKAGKEIRERLNRQ